MKTTILFFALLMAACSVDPEQPRYMGTWEAEVNGVTLELYIGSEHDKRTTLTCFDRDSLNIPGMYNNGSTMKGSQGVTTFQYWYTLSGDEMHGDLLINIQSAPWYEGPATFKRR